MSAMLQEWKDSRRGKGALLLCAFGHTTTATKSWGLCGCRGAKGLILGEHAYRISFKGNLLTWLVALNKQWFEKHWAIHEQDLFKEVI